MQPGGYIPETKDDLCFLYAPGTGGREAAD